MKTNFKNEWAENEFLSVPKKLAKYFAGKTLFNQRNETVRFNGTISQIENQFGIPYTSSSSFALMSLDCNANFRLKKDDYFYFSYVAINEDNQIVLVLHDNEKNEVYLSI